MHGGSEQDTNYNETSVILDRSPWTWTNRTEFGVVTSPDNILETLGAFWSHSFDLRPVDGACVSDSHTLFVQKI